jgi:hypothetical protein
MVEQPNELLLVKFELMSKTFLHCVTPNNTHTNWDNQRSLNKSRGTQIQTQH